MDPGPLFLWVMCYRQGSPTISHFAIPNLNILPDRSKSLCGQWERVSDPRTIPENPGRVAPCSAVAGCVLPMFALSPASGECVTLETRGEDPRERQHPGGRPWRLPGLRDTWSGPVPVFYEEAEGAVLHLGESPVHLHCLFMQVSVDGIGALPGTTALKDNVSQGEVPYRVQMQVVAFPQCLPH